MGDQWNVGMPMGTPQAPWRLAANAWWNNAVENLTGYGGYAYETSLPPTAFNGVQRALISGLSGYNNIAFKFFGYMDDDNEEPVPAEGKVGRARIWGFNPFTIGNIPAYHYIGDPLVDLRFTMGAASVTGTNYLPPTTSATEIPYLADAITVLSDKSLFPGARVITDETGAWAQVVLDGIAYGAFVIELAKGVEDPADHVGALYRVF